MRLPIHMPFTDNFHPILNTDEKFAFLCPNGSLLENGQNQRKGKMRCILKLTSPAKVKITCKVSRKRFQEKNICINTFLREF